MRKPLKMTDNAGNGETADLASNLSEMLVHLGKRWDQLAYAQKQILSQ